MSAKFLISILTYRMESGVKKCIESVMLGGGHFTFHLTANGPAATDYFLGIQAMFNIQHHSFDRLMCWPKVVINEVNEGFVSPNNTAMRHAQENDFDYLVTLNDDATVPVGWLEAIEAEFNRHPAAAIVGAQGACRTLGDNFHGHMGQHLDFIEGSCAAYKVSVWKKHFKSLYPEGLQFAYGEDSSTSLEVRRLGYTIHQANFQIQHERGSTSKHVPKVNEYQAKNHAWAIKRYGHYLKTRRFDTRIIVRRLAAAGDVLLITPVIRKLYEQNPLSKICVETYFPELFEGNPCVSLAAKKIAREQDDLVYDLDMISENAPMRHFVTSYARECGVEVELPCKTEIYWKEDKFSGLLKGDKWVAVHAGSSTWRAKEYHAEKWNEVLAGLVSDGWKTILVGSGILPGINMELVSLDMRSMTKTVNELGALLSHVNLFVGIDSFPAHCASAVGVPAITLHGVTDSKYIVTAENAVGLNADQIIHPRAGERHRVAGMTEIAENGECVNSITPDRILDAVQQLTSKKIHA